MGCSFSRNPPPPIIIAGVTNETRTRGIVTSRIQVEQVEEGVFSSVIPW